MKFRTLHVSILLSSLQVGSIASYAQTNGDSSRSPTNHQSTTTAAGKQNAKAKKASTPTPIQVDDVTNSAPEAQVQPTASTRSTKLIRQNGNPTGGRIDLTPYVGSYVLIGFETGVMGGHRILPKGFIPMINNSISVEAGMHYARWSILGLGGSRFAMTGDMRWDFHVHPTWTPYAAAGLVLERRWIESSTLVSNSFTPQIKVGTFLHLSNQFGMRFEFAPSMGSHRVGVTFSH